MYIYIYAYNKMLYSIDDHTSASPTTNTKAHNT